MKLSLFKASTIRLLTYYKYFFSFVKNGMSKYFFLFSKFKIRSLLLYIKKCIKVKKLYLCLTVLSLRYLCLKTYLLCIYFIYTLNWMILKFLIVKEKYYFRILRTTKTMHNEELEQPQRQLQQQQQRHLNYHHHQQQHGIHCCCCSC